MEDEREVEICDECSEPFRYGELWDEVSDETGEWQIVRWCACPSLYVAVIDYGNIPKTLTTPSLQDTRDRDG